MAKTAYEFTALTGGAATALDSVDGDLLVDGDFAFIAASGTSYIYLLDDDLAGAENSPWVISPDTNAGNKRWVLQAPMGAGAWVTPTYNAGDFTASAGNWTVDEADIVTLAYTIMGKTMIVNFAIQNTDVSAGPVTLRIAIPASKTAAKTAYAWAMSNNAAGGWGSSMCSVTADGTTINIYKDVAGNVWTATASDNTAVQGHITFEIK